MPSLIRDPHTQHDIYGRLEKLCSPVSAETLRRERRSTPCKDASLFYYSSQWQVPHFLQANALPQWHAGGTAWHWEWISRIALAICIWVGAHFHGPPRTTLTVMLNWFPLGQAGEQFTESCGDVRCYRGAAEEGLCLQSRLGDIRSFLLRCQMLCFLKKFTCTDVKCFMGYMFT